MFLIAKSLRNCCEKMMQKTLQNKLQTQVKKLQKNCPGYLQTEHSAQPRAIIGLLAVNLCVMKSQVDEIKPNLSIQWLKSYKLSFLFANKDNQSRILYCNVFKCQNTN